MGAYRTLSTYNASFERKKSIRVVVMESKEKPAASSGKWRQIIPNALTITRIILVPIFIALMIMQHLRGSVSLLIVSLVVFCVASYTDHLDGKLARRWKVVSDFGKLVDPIADKALMISAFVLLSLFQNLWWWFTAVVILREVAVTLLRMYLLRSGVVLPASKGGKIKTSLQILMVFLWMLAGICYPFNTQVGVVIMYLAIAVLIAAFVATVLSGMVYFLDAHDNHKEQAKAAGSEDKSDPLKSEEDTAERGEGREATPSKEWEQKTTSSLESGSKADSEPGAGKDTLDAKKTWEPRAKPAARRAAHREQKTEKTPAPATTSAQEAKEGEKSTESDHSSEFPSRRTRRAQEARKAAREAKLAGEGNDRESHSRGQIPDLSAVSASPTPSANPEPAGESPEPKAAEQMYGETPRFAMTRSQLRKQQKK